MASIALERTDVIVGVDTHKDSHVAVAIDGVGGRLDELRVPATDAGSVELLEWACSHGDLWGFGVEGTGSYGAGLARFLRRRSMTVVEVTRPPRAGDRRRDGKSDSIDAEHAARQVLAGRATAVPKATDGVVEAIRVTRVARSGAVKARSQAITALKSILVTAPDDLRAQLEPLPNRKLMAACAALDGTGDLRDPGAATRRALAAMAQRWTDLDTEIRAHDQILKDLTTAAAPALVDAYGIGPDIAGELLTVAGDNTDRLHSEAAFAKLCGVCPIPTGSGKTDGEHRLNRGGNRQANAALHRAVIVRMRWHEPTRAYVERRTTEGLTKKRIIRCLKRYLARELYQLLPQPTATAT